MITQISHTAKFKTFIENTALHNKVSHHSLEACDQSTYINGKKNLDYFFVSEDILLVSTGIGHTPYGSPFISDHRGLCWEISSAALFESILPGHIRVPQRGLHVDRPRKYQAYIEHLRIMCTKHDILDKAVTIENKLYKEASQHEK